MNIRVKLKKTIVSAAITMVLIITSIPVTPAKIAVRAADSSDESWPREVTLDAPESIIPTGVNTLPQTDLTGDMKPVTFTVSDTSKYYFPEDYESLGEKYGITVSYVNRYQLLVTGRPQLKTTPVTLAAPNTKAVVQAPAVSGGAGKIKNTTTDMEYAASAGASDWQTCTDSGTETAAGTWYVRYKGTEDAQPSTATQVIVTEASGLYDILVVFPDEAKKTMTLDEDSGGLWQKEITDDYTPVIFNAKTGYYFPDDYPTVTKSGISLTVVNEAQIKISGTPTGSPAFTIEPARKKKTTPSKPSGVAGDIMKITGTTDKMEYADYENPDVWNKCDPDETEVSTAGVKFVRYKETDTANSSEIATVIVKEDTDNKTDTGEEGFTVTIENPQGSHITIGTETENLYRQTGITGAMKNVYYYADGEYYFPSSYKVSSVNGIRVVRTGAKMLTVKGTPTADTTITLEKAIDINTPLYKASIINGAGTEKYVAGTAVEITAENKSGKTFTGWRVNSGNVSLINAKSETTSFVMPPNDVEIEACYSSGSSTDISANTSADTSGNVKDTGNGSDTGSNNKASGSVSDNSSVTPVEGGNSSGDSSTSGGTNSETTGGNVSTVTPLSDAAISNNSKILDVSAKVVWNSGAWKLTWNKIEQADGYDVFLCEGKKNPSNGSYVQVTGGNSVRAFLKTVNGKAVNKTKVYSFVVKAYRVVNKTKEYIGTSRVLYAAGNKNKTYTNVKKLKPSKKTVTVNLGKRKKLQTQYKKQKSSKKLVSNSSGKKLNYYSTNEAVATVDSSGRVYGISRGTSTIYVVAHNGVKTKVTVTVK